MADYSFDMSNGGGQQPPQQPPPMQGGYTDNGYGAYNNNNGGAAPPPAQPYAPGPPQDQGGNYYAPQQGGVNQPPMFDNNSIPGFGNVPGGMGADILGGYAKQVGEKHFNEMAGEVKKIVNVGQLKFYFQVDTPYVLKKLRLLLFPFMPGTSWYRQGKEGKMLTPKQDINSPDLYIPIMSFLTFTLVSCLVNGTFGRFSGDQLGDILSSNVVFVIVEVLIFYGALWLMNISELGIYDVLAFSGYKYFGMVLAPSAFLLTRMYMVQQVVMFWTMLTLAYTLVQTIRHVDLGNKKLLYIGGAMAAIEVLFIWWFTSGLAKADNVIASDDDLPAKL